MSCRVALSVRLLVRSICLSLLFLLSACDSKTAEEHVASAIQDIANGQEQAALIELKNAVRKNPGSKEAHSLLGQTRYLMGEMPIALKELERALNLGSDDEATRIYILKTKLALGRYSEIVGELEESANLAPPFAIALANAYIAAGDFEKARPLVEQGMHLADGLVSAARLAQIDNDMERAQSYLGHAVQLAPREISTWLYKGEIEIARGQAGLAVKSFEAARLLPGGNVHGAIGIIRALLVDEKIDEAAARMEGLGKQVTQTTTVKYLNGLIKFRQGDLTGAEDVLRNLQQYAPDHLITLYLLGVVQSQKGQLEQAAESLSRYLVGDPGNVSARKILAIVYTKSGKPDDVIEVLRPLDGKHSDPQIWTLIGRAAQRKGDMNAANDAYQKAVELAPDIAPIRNQLALSLLSSGQEQAAKTELSIAVELDENQFESDYILVMVETRNGNFDAANEAVARMLSKTPDNPMGYHLQGVVHLAKKETEAAVASFQTALQHDPGYYPAVHNLVAIHERSGEFELAATRLKTVISTVPDNQAVQLGYVDFLLRRGDPESALVQLETTLKQFPDSTRARLAQARILLATQRIDEAIRAVNNLMVSEPDLPDVLLLKANVDLAAGDRTGAKAAVSRLQSLLENFQNNARLLAAVGALQLRTGDYTVARKNLERAVELPRVPVSVRLNLARLELEEGRPRNAQAQLETLKRLGLKAEAIALLEGDVKLASADKDEAFAHFQAMARNGSRRGTSRYALMQSARSDVQGALATLYNWLKEHPGDLGMRMVVADVGIRHGLLNTAKVEYEAMMPSDDPLLLNNLAWIYMEEGDSRVEEVARRAYAVMPNNAEISDTLGWILVSQGRSQEGLQLLRSSARNKPQDPAIQFHLAVAYEHEGNRVLAHKAATRALRNNKAFAGRKEAEDLLVRLNNEVMPTATVATPAPPARECRVWGPRATAGEFSEVERQLVEEGGFPEIRATEVRASPLYHVYIDVLDSQTQARRIVQELESINIDNLSMQRDSEVIVSVGVYSRPLLADDQLSMMQELGYEAKIEEMPRQQTVYKLYGYVKPDAPAYAKSSAPCDYDESFEVSTSS